MNGADAGERGLVFAPLGGVGEIGMNASLYGCDGRWLMVDLGVLFGGDRLPGVDVAVPDIAFAEARAKRIEALVLTHAHEDHLGALPHLWPLLGCPVYATRFTAAVLAQKLDGAGLGDDVPVTLMEPGRTLRLGPFSVTPVAVTHSIPDACALLIETPYGRVVHTGDWKIDPRPLVGRELDEGALRRAGEAGVLALVCDSTNVLRPGESGSEAAVRESLCGLVRNAPGAVFVTLFASNIARVQTIAEAARAAGREAVIVGRALGTYLEAARRAGFLDGTGPGLSESDAEDLPRERVLYLCTGCQGEPAAALSRIAGGGHPRIAVQPGDRVIFSSRIIPGNEVAIARLANLLTRRGAEVINENGHFVHVSGHPSEAEVERMYEWVRPRVAVPVHGEARHLAAHARLARRLGVPRVHQIEDGDILRLGPEPSEVVGRAEAGRLVLDGGVLTAPDAPSLRARRRMMIHGVAFVVLVLDQEGHPRTRPRVTELGVLDPGPEAEALAEAEERLVAVLDALPKPARRDDGAVADTVRALVRRHLGEARGKRPLVEVQVIRI